MTVQNTSSFSKRTVPACNICQFMVNGYGSQSDSIIPVNGEIPDRGSLKAPVVSRFQPGGVRNKYPVWKVTMPRAKFDIAKCSSGNPSGNGSSARTVGGAGWGPPSQ